uniref:RHS repeat domain-containing protein n=1 Tax=Bacteroidaceae TaxID=815 RepID=UPI00356B50C9
WVWNGNVPLHQWKQHREYSVVEDRWNTDMERRDMTVWLFDENSFVPVAMLKEGRSYSILTDQLGTPTEAYDAEGNEVWSRVLDMDGNVIGETGNKGMVPFLFQGQYYDRETGLAYNRFRYYSPKMGMYVSQDPIGLGGGILNLYGYVDNTNTWIDSWGLAKHHTTPRQVYNPRKYKRVDGTTVRPAPILTNTVATDKRIRGTKKEPNMWNIPDDVHSAIHNPNSDISKRNGGDYNSVFIQRVTSLPNPTVEAVLAVRDQMAKDYDIEKYRPKKIYQK